MSQLLDKVMSRLRSFTMYDLVVGFPILGGVQCLEIRPKGDRDHEYTLTLRLDSKLDFCLNEVSGRMSHWDIDLSEKLVIIHELRKLVGYPEINTEEELAAMLRCAELRRAARKEATASSKRRDDECISKILAEAARHPQEEERYW